MKRIVAGFIALATIFVLTAFAVMAFAQTKKYEPIAEVATVETTPEVIVIITEPEETTELQTTAAPTEEESTTDYDTTESSYPQNEIWTDLGTFTTSAYCLCPKCCGKNYWKCLTASGVAPKRYVTVAVDPDVIPLGTRIYIEGLGYRIAQDTGSAVKDKWIDVYVGEDNHAYASEYGLQKRNVWIVTEREEK